MKHRSQQDDSDMVLLARMKTYQLKILLGRVKGENEKRLIRTELRRRAK